MEWINIKDRQPEGQCIAIGYQREITIGYISTDRIGNDIMGTGYLCGNNYETLTHVTHWMELPKAPK